MADAVASTPYLPGPPRRAENQPPVDEQAAHERALYVYSKLFLDAKVFLESAGYTVTYTGAGEAPDAAAAEKWKSETQPQPANAEEALAKALGAR